MTTVTDYRGTDLVVAHLRTLWQRRRRTRVLAALCTLLAAACAMTLVVTLAAGYGQEQPARWLRWALLLTTAGTGAVTALLVLRGLLWRQNVVQNARFAESALGGLDNVLTNTMLLPHDTLAEPALVQAAIDEAAARAGSMDLLASVDARALRRSAFAAGGLLLVVLAILAFQGRHVARGMRAVLGPGDYVPTIGAVEVVGVHVAVGQAATLQSPDATLYLGEPATIILELRNDARTDYRVSLLYTDREHAEPVEQPMLAASDRATYTLPLGTRTADTEYFLEIARPDGRVIDRLPRDRRAYRLTVVDRPGIEEVSARCRYPDYTALPEETRPAGELRVPLGTRVELALRTARPAPLALLHLRGRPPLPMAAGSDERLFSAAFDVLEDGGWYVQLCDSAGRPVQRLPELASLAEGARGYGSTADESREAYFRIVAVPDKPPTVSIPVPGSNVMAPPGGQVELRIRLADDYGLTDAALWIGPKDQPARPEPLPLDPALRQTELRHVLQIPADTPEGTVLQYQVSAADNRRLPGLEPQTGRSGLFDVLVQDPVAVEAERARRYDELNRRLEALLQIQADAKRDNLLARQRGQAVADLPSLTAPVLAGQQRLVAEADDLVRTFPFEGELVKIQQALFLLGRNEMARAVAQAEVLAAVREPEARTEPSDALLVTQDEILQALQFLLASMPLLAGRADTTTQAAGADLEAQYQQRLQELSTRLDAFIEEQRRVVAASDRLAQKPVDTFTAEDEELLHELQAVEDRWDRFLNEAFTDFSKLAQQDFSSPSLLQELLAIRTDVTMARDALAKRAIEIATALEDNGIENAERLTANIEKWLPDVPDREQWVMEDPAEQMNIEMPELPTELEDLVGELLEQEEDLFEELDDVTGKYAMSGNEGVGWDALDGPISNMNAQGVTGNQLPNSSEMSGRSGEGRQGRSSGEFVEGVAEGKDGRRTPTRLTPEPFQQGQIDDRSGAPAGGTTGGGKVGGAGGEGLEGPLPPPLQREMQRLAGRQAQLVQQAERLQARFAVSDYSNYQFLRAVTLMNRVQGDLEANRYHNALRQRGAVVDTLRSSHMLLSRQIDVRYDAGDAVPKYVRDDIHDAMQGPMPAQYRDVLESYLRKLGDGAPRP